MLLSSACSRTNDFERLIKLKRYSDNKEAAYELARQLRGRPDGIDAAVSDLSVTGGRSQGLGTWILITSPLTNYVQSKLEAISSSTSEDINKRIEASWVLWLRTGELKYLEDLFLLVKEPGADRAIDYGRRYLQKSLASNAERFRNELAIESNRPISISLEEFKARIRQPGAVFKEEVPRE